MQTITSTTPRALPPDAALALLRTQPMTARELAERAYVSETVARQTLRELLAEGAVLVAPADNGDRGARIYTVPLRDIVLHALERRQATVPELAFSLKKSVQAVYRALRGLVADGSVAFTLVARDWSPKRVRLYRLATEPPREQPAPSDWTPWRERPLSIKPERRREFLAAIAERPMTVQELADVHWVVYNCAYQTVSRLEGAGLVAWTPAPSCGRGAPPRRYHLTDAGRADLAALEAGIEVAA